MPALARLLDLTRLVSRLGKGQPTGIDRVEAAYLRQCLSLTDPVFGLIRSKLGFLLLDRTGMRAFQDLIAQNLPLPRADLLSRVTRRNDQQLGRAETAARGLSVARCRPSGLPDMLRIYMPDGFAYLNTGHANLTSTSLRAIKTAGAASLAVFIHDTIPLDHPAFTRPDTIARFDKKLSAVSACADLVIHSAQATRSQTEQHLGRHGRIPPGITAPIGISALHPNANPPREHPYFVALGTIEPRKNHAFLLNIWEALHRDLPADEVPHLLILGRRGWLNEPVFKRLDNSSYRNKTIFEWPGLPDDQVANLLLHARALLFPSFAEGYGLPPLEAASLGVAVIVPPLPVYRETLGNYPVYASLDDSYSWLETIIRLKDGTIAKKQVGLGQGETVNQAVAGPLWKDHFNTVLNLI